MHTNWQVHNKINNLDFLVERSPVTTQSQPSGNKKSDPPNVTDRFFAIPKMKKA